MPGRWPSKGTAVAEEIVPDRGAGPCDSQKQRGAEPRIGNRGGQLGPRESSVAGERLTIRPLRPEGLGGSQASTLPTRRETARERGAWRGLPTGAMCACLLGRVKSPVPVSIPGRAKAHTSRSEPSLLPQKGTPHGRFPSDGLPGPPCRQRSSPGRTGGWGSGPRHRVYSRLTAPPSTATGVGEAGGVITCAAEEPGFRWGLARRRQDGSEVGERGGLLGVSLGAGAQWAGVRGWWELSRWGELYTSILRQHLADGEPPGRGGFCHPHAPG